LGKLASAQRCFMNRQTMPLAYRRCSYPLVNRLHWHHLPNQARFFTNQIRQ
jgi:hypothetical protein